MKKLNLNQLGGKSLQCAREKGFYEKTVTVENELLQVIGELSKEAFDAIRCNNRCKITPYDLGDTGFEQYVKDTFEDEIADAIIRLLTMSARLNIDIDGHVLAKMKYNETREYLHGKH